MNRHALSIVTGACAASLSTLAQAHHAMGNALPGSAFEGLLSGLAHPVIGLDHLLFVLAMGAACFYFDRRVGSVGAFIAATVAGTILHVYEANLPYVELLVASSLVVLGILVMRATPVLGSKAGPVFFALAGIAHGYAYGESIVGAEATPLATYLLGFIAIQACVATAGYALARHAHKKRASGFAQRAVGATASVAGAAFVLLALMAAV